MKSIINFIALNEAISTNLPFIKELMNSSNEKSRKFAEQFANYWIKAGDIDQAKYKSVSKNISEDEIKKLISENPNSGGYDVIYLGMEASNKVLLGRIRYEPGKHPNVIERHPRVHDQSDMINFGKEAWLVSINLGKVKERKSKAEPWIHDNYGKSTTHSLEPDSLYDYLMRIKVPPKSTFTLRSKNRTSFNPKKSYTYRVNQIVSNDMILIDSTEKYGDGWLFVRGKGLFSLAPGLLKYVPEDYRKYLPS